MRARSAIYRLMLGLLFLLAAPAWAWAGNPYTGWLADPRGEIPHIMRDHRTRAPLGRVKSLRTDVYAGERQAGGGVAKRAPEQRTIAPLSLGTVSILGEYPVFAIKAYPSLERYSRNGELTEQILYNPKGTAMLRVCPAYGAHGRLESETVCRDAETGCAVIRYTYTPDRGLLAAITLDAAWLDLGEYISWGDSFPRSIRHEYDGSGCLVRIRALPLEEKPQDGEAQEEVWTFAYEEEEQNHAPRVPGRLRSVTYVTPSSEGIPWTVHYRYEQTASGLWRYEGRGPGLAWETAVLWDASGNVLRVRDNRVGCSEQIYERDEKGRIVRVTRSSGDKALRAGNLKCVYEYDRQGRLVRATLDFDGRKDWLVETYEYDEHDNWIRAGISETRATPDDGGESRSVVIERRIEYWEK